MIPLSISEKFLQLAGGEQLPASKLKHAIIAELIRDEIIRERIAGLSKRTLYISNASALEAWLYNRFAISDLRAYIATMKDDNASRRDIIAASSDSKVKRIRTYKGFLVNSYAPVSATLNGEPHSIKPLSGTFQFIYDYENFIPAPDVAIVGVENMENFRHVDKEKYLFNNLKPLFVSRYPQEQSKDLIRWLRMIPNRYVHFGDCDFAGINIYLNEYKAHLGDRATFFVAPGIEEMLIKYGNPRLYDQQKALTEDMPEPNLRHIISLMHQYKRCLEQEIFIVK